MSRSHDVMRAVAGRGWQSIEEIAWRMTTTAERVSPDSLAPLVWWLEQRGWLRSRLVTLDTPLSAPARDGTTLTWRRRHEWISARLAPHA